MLDASTAMSSSRQQISSHLGTRGRSLQPAARSPQPAACSLQPYTRWQPCNPARWSLQPDVVWWRLQPDEMWWRLQPDEMWWRLQPDVM